MYAGNNDTMKRPQRETLPAIGLLLLASLSIPATAADYPLRSPLVGNVKVVGGFWGPRLTTNATSTLTHNFDFLEKTPRLANFDKAAGIDKRHFVGNAAYDSDVFKIIEGAAYSLQTRRDEVDANALSRQVGRIIAAQQPDGFLCTKFILEKSTTRWDDNRKSHLLYSAGHLFEAGVAYFDATGKRNLLEASCRYADLIDARFGPGKVYDVPGHQEIELSLVKLYRATGEQRYLKLGKFFLDQRGYVQGGSERVRAEKPRSDDYDQDRVPLIEETRAVGHAVRAGYTYAAMADMAALYGDRNYAQALDRIWQDVVERKLYITGASATGQYDDEGFGDPYCLPNETAYCETCGTAATVLWSQRMALLHGDACYIDVLERALYNGVISGISLDGDSFFYTNPLASRGYDRRRSNFDPACCQSNLVRIIPQVGSMAYATDPESVYVNLFVAGEGSFDIAGGTFRLKQETDYPRDGRVRFTVEAAGDKPSTIAIRIPGWALGRPVPGDLYQFATIRKELPTLGLNGTTLRLDPDKPEPSAPIHNGYVRLRRTWKQGDVIELNLPMPVRRVLANDKVEADRGRVALQRGPLVYCVEAIDNGDVRTNAIVLTDDIALDSVRRNDLLGDVVTIVGDVAVAHEPKAGGPVELQLRRLVAIPYYAWANRGEGYMDVWLARSAAAATPVPAATAGAVAQVSASAKRPAGQLAALTDRRAGPSSSCRATPRFSWPESSTDSQWIQYEWDEARELSQCAVYWAVDTPSPVYWRERPRGSLLKLPKSWKLLYRDGNAWRPVETKGGYAVQSDRSNEICFTPVKTTAVRLETEMSDAPCGIQEWLID
jgi:hypothetical protein